MTSTDLIKTTAKLDDDCSVVCVKLNHLKPEIKRAVGEIILCLMKEPACTVFGKPGKQHRNVGFFAVGDSIVGYRFAGQIAKAQPMGEHMKKLLNLVNEIFGANYNGVLVNEYEDGNHYIGEHSDSEKDLDPLAGVVAISVGAERKFRIRNKETKTKYDFKTKHLWALQMKGSEFQKRYTHGIPKQKKIDRPRVSLTFRKHTK